ncbi:uncharacterized protein LOC112515774 [Cynara cardunculus var. scolymus]|uniref:Uncharacterized protein n=1 Tax=Cynara cardunculus var. scolymus TaxID=59895 RepID=A0A103XKE0_CYNCS|nr:uncharacterized protein LOC112515774 [Cynara cardunculus var. scolymus]KVH92219.1 hypothetical protein Ccrd_005736 [Cynara cardunculus var. scolymus]
MSGEIPSDGDYKPRSALGDVTNQVGKRGFSFISTSGVKSGDGYKKDEGFQFAKKECLRVDNFSKENFHKEIAGCVLRAHSCSEINSLKGNVVNSISKITCEAKEPCTSDGRRNATSSIAVKAGNAMSESCISTPTIPTSKSDKLGAHVIIETEEDEKSDSAVVENASKEKVENSLGMDDDAGIENLDSSKDEYLDCSRLPESQESRCGLERCIGQKGDGFSNMCMDLIKACPCSFCTKAAYIWSDLHYQDIKGRIAAIKKSQKEASILVHQNSRDGATGKYGQGSSEKFSNLESDLTGQWMSLFLHMEDIFVREGSQLERSLSILKELRDNCKTDSQKQ